LIWHPLLEKVSVIIDCSSGYSDPGKAADVLLEDVKKGVKQFTDKRFTYIYTSGLWVYGSDLGKVVDETSSTEKSIPIVAWRPPLEKRIVAAKEFDGIVIRPGLVHGRSGSIYSMIFTQVETGSVTLINDDQTRTCPIHADDLAETYVHAVERINITKGQIFNVANRQTENFTDIVKAMARAAKKEIKITYKEPSNPFEVAFGIHSPTFDINKAITLLGFEQKRLGVVDGMDQYYRSWKAHQ
jgi:nucleoside-diphosphate-sugar epimerase